jgi:hypothetical protein
MQITNVNTAYKQKALTRAMQSQTSSIALVLFNILAILNIDVMCRKWRARE